MTPWIWSSRTNKTVRLRSSPEDLSDNTNCEPWKRFERNQLFKECTDELGVNEEAFKVRAAQSCIGNEKELLAGESRSKSLKSQPDT